MEATVSPAVLELLAWVARCPRTYAATMEAWRSTCPRHTTWEDATIAGFVRVERDWSGGQASVMLTTQGRAALEQAVPLGSAWHNT